MIPFIGKEIVEMCDYKLHYSYERNGKVIVNIPALRTVFEVERLKRKFNLTDVGGKTEGKTFRFEKLDKPQERRQFPVYF